MVTFAVAEICLQSIYGGFCRRQAAQQSDHQQFDLATGMTDVVTYIQLSIMNTNSRFNSEFHLANAWLLLASFLLQLFIITIFAYGGNEIYFHFTPPEACIIITTSQYSLNKIVPKIKRYGKQYQIVDVVDYSSIQVYDRILACDTVFLYDIPWGNVRG